MKSIWLVNLLLFNKILHYRKDTNMSIWGHYKTCKNEMKPVSLEMKTSDMRSHVADRVAMENWEHFRRGLN